MRVRCLTWVMVLVLASTVAYSQPAEAQTPSVTSSPALLRMKQLNKKALESYDALEFEGAKKDLLEALSVAEKAAINKGKTLTSTYLILGLVFGAGLNDRINAIKYFTAALLLNANAKLDAARATPVLEEMFSSARDNARSMRKSTNGATGKAGFRHAPVQEAAAGKPIRLKAKVSPELGAKSVVLYYRVGDVGDYKQMNMQEETPGNFVTVIPGTEIEGATLVSYYLETIDQGGHRLPGSGDIEAPHEITIVADGEKIIASSEGGEEVAIGRRFFVALYLGTGAGFVNGGQSERSHPQANMPDAQVDIRSGGALAPLHVQAEFGYMLTELWQVSALLRLQTLNVMTPNSLSFLGEARAKRYFSQGTFRPFFALGVGAGQIRHRIPLGDYDGSTLTPDDIVDTRIAGTAAFGLGGGINFMFTNNLGLAAEVNGLILVPNNFAAHLDVNMGVVYNF